MGGEHVIEVSNLTKVYSGNTVVNDISFNVMEGEIFGFLGPNGAGKTTTIRMMLALIHSDNGSVKICGYDIKKEFLKAISNVGAVVETPKFYLGLSGYMNLKLIANLHPEVTKDRIDEVVELVGLKNKIGGKVKTYSLGMKQRLGIARAMLHQPRLVILDEPTNGLDPKGIKEMRELICDLASKQKITFFISSHLLHEVEQMCSSVVILNRGEVIKNGLVKDILNEEKNLEEFFLKITGGDDQLG